MAIILRRKYGVILTICCAALAGCSTPTPEQQQINRAMALQMLMNMSPPPKAQFTPMQIAPMQAAPVSSTNSVTAMWTGNQRQVQTVTNQFGWTCEYRYLAQTFWRTFVGTCPTSVQVQ